MVTAAEESASEAELEPEREPPGTSEAELDIAGTECDQGAAALCKV